MDEISVTMAHFYKWPLPTLVIFSKTKYFGYFINIKILKVGLYNGDYRFKLVLLKPRNIFSTFKKGPSLERFMP
jgi:hypothetical protein